jgi:RHS repeat-associated protein
MSLSLSLHCHGKRKSRGISFCLGNEEHETTILLCRGNTGCDDNGDHLGSNAITTSSSGVRSAEIRYMPWGTMRYTYGSSPTTIPRSSGQVQYNGQRVESSLGLLFYNARFYDPYLARFIQADTIVPGGVQGLDRYAYVNNNPVNHTDPSGHEICDADGIVSLKNLSQKKHIKLYY